MSHKISVHNKSERAQTFEVHGWDDNKTISVPAHGTTKIDAPNGSSGAIIAVHDGHEGEQVEITKDGFGGNDFFDVSYIIGAGGNITVMQSGDPATLKGDPEFMQALNAHWHKADQKTRDAIKASIETDKSRNAIRLDRPASNPTLEKFVREFANGYGYIGPGSWNGNNGNDSDNKQSSAAHGNKDIIITYNDGDARPDSVKPASNVHVNQYTIKAGDSFYTIAKSHGLSLDDIMAANPGVDSKKLHVGQVINLRQQTPPVQKLADPVIHAVEALQVQPAKPTAPSDKDNSKTLGIILTNKSHQAETYYFYNNLWNGNGTAGANFDHPLKSITVSAGQSSLVSLPTSFKGRVQRGKQIPATWVEFQIEASNDHKAHGDVSVEQGDDGPATIRSTDGTDVEGGFTSPIHAEAGAYVVRGDGKRVVASTVGNWMGGPNQAAVRAQSRIRGSTYVTGGTGVPDVASANRRFAVTFY